MMWAGPASDVLCRPLLRRAQIHLVAQHIVVIRLLDRFTAVHGGSVTDGCRSLPLADRQSRAPSIGGGEARGRSGDIDAAVENTLNSLLIDIRVMREILHRIEARARPL